MSKLHFTALCLLVLLCTPAAGQRTMSSQGFVGGDFIWSSRPCGQLRCGQYLSSSLWEVTLGARSYSKGLSTGDTLQYTDIVASGSWSYRLACTRSRAVNLYGGAGIFAGYELYDPARRLPSTLDLGFGKGAFIYGIQAGLHAELFFARRCAFVLGGSIPVCFGSHADWFRWEATAGIRFNL